MRAEIKEQFQHFMDVRSIGVRVTESDGTNPVQGNAAAVKNESAYREVPQIPQEQRIDEDETLIAGKRNRGVSMENQDVEKVEEAVMNDDVIKFKKLNMTIE